MRKRNKFSLSHYKLCTMDMGKLVPVSWYEVLPGDTVQQKTSAFIRVAPTLAPIMTPCHVTFKSFFVPFRILWDNGPDDCWENFITGGPDGMNASTPPGYILPAGGTIRVGTLLDYLGVPAGEPFQTDLKVSAFPLRSYFRIWNEFFRDQDLQDPLNVGEDITGTTYTSGNEWLLTRLLDTVSWKKDYFTVARPFEQKGPAVTIPVNLTGSDGSTPLVTASTTLSGGGVSFSGGIRNASYIGGSGSSLIGSTSDNDYEPGQIDLTYTRPNAQTTVTWNGSADTTGSISINDIREGFALQRMEEARALFGSRYVEYLRYLGVRSSDARLQRPEYLGGGSQVIQWSEVVQTGEGNDPVGTLRGHGVSAGRTKRWRRFFEEHGIVMTVAYIRPLAMYTQGLSRSWSREIKEDYWQKELEHVGQQEVLNKELYAIGAAPDNTFGFMDKYDEYRSIPNSIAGNFRDTLDYWHLGRVFSSQPVLNGSFIECNPSKRIFAEQTAHEFYCMFLHSVQARRLLSKTGRPGAL